MIGVLKKIWDFAGEEQDNIRKSMILGFFYAVFHTVSYTHLTLPTKLEV